MILKFRFKLTLCFGPLINFLWSLFVKPGLGESFLKSLVFKLAGLSVFKVLQLEKLCFTTFEIS